MCIGMPMQVREVQPGHALVEGRGELRRVNTALVGDVAPGDWLLIFIDGAREALSAERAAEVNATLDLLDAALHGHSGAGDAAAFDLPSAMTAEQLTALTGHPPRA
jgi:hydrogenase expression/formation protein HypC